jgi:protein SCO1/2
MSLLRRPWFWTSLASIILAAAFLYALNLRHRADAAPLMKYATLSDFQLVDQSGAPFGSRELRGRAWVANFIFTRCATVCPAFTAKMAELQTRTASLGDKLRLVSFSVDPDYDKPPVLAAYAQKFRADHTRWTFLTGGTNDVKRTVVDGLKILMQENPQAENVGESILHGSHFVLLDAEMRVRGYYDSNDVDATERLVRDIDRVLAGE